jgi:hypothetical protein
MAIGDMLSGLLGGSAGKSEMEKATKLQKDSIARLEALGIPSIEAQRIALEAPELVGQLEAEILGPSALESVSVDPRLRQAQMQALEQMSGLADVGLGAEDRAAFNELRRGASAQAQAQAQSVLQNAAAQGTLDSGSALAAQLMAGQQSADRMSQEGDRLAANAAAARRQALQSKAQFASQLGQQDFSQKATSAQARDAINQFNTQNRQNVAGTNLANRQSIANQGTATRNQQEMYNKGLLQQDFQNRLSKATGTNQAAGNLAQTYAGQGQAAAQGQANMTTGLLSTGMQLGAAAMARPSAAGSTGTGGGNVTTSSGSVNPFFDEAQMKADLFGKGQP